MELTPTMKAEAKKMIEYIDDRLSCNGCNDWYCASPEVANEIFNFINPDADRMPPRSNTIYDFDIMAMIKKALDL